ncbi:hypothetical protein PQX77_002898 [Marasmius sp. AFHP31]|nr:hypothetical protein PQX77_002898 [Marasmius sp. AFHP31]
MDAPDSDDLRLHTITPTTPPTEASLSDFGYAAAPAFGVYLQHSKGLRSEDKPRVRREFLALIWNCWSDVWDGGTEFGDGKLTRKQKSLLKDIIAHITSEYDLHRYYVRIGRKVDVLSQSNAQWSDTMTTAIRQSQFQRWADPEYVLAIRPPPPPPTPAIGAQYADLPWEEAWQAMLHDYMAADLGRGVSNESSVGEDAEKDWMFEFH